MKTFSLPSEEPKGRPDFLSQLNEQQRQAVTHTDGALLIVAGAGSGKTRVLTFRIAYLLQQYKAAPEQILALTFTNKAAREMKDRIRKLIGDKAGKLWMGTFHSIFSKILRFEADKIGFGSDFTIYDTNDSQTVVKQILQELNYDTKEIKPKTIHNKISDSKNQLITADTFQEKFISSTLDDITSKVYKIYNKRLKQSNAMDFDDLLVKPIELFQQHPDILEKYQDRFKYILIDEYQDTNHAQYKVTKMLADKYQNICVVGDDAQSIYSFRGADISNILNFKEDYDKATQVPLEQNYRSTKAILQCADSIIKQNTKQLDKTLWTEQDYGERITLLENFDERDEANRIASHIQNLKMRHGYENNEFAILYRTNYQSRVFEESLRRKDLTYQLVGGLSFYQRKEVKDVLAYLTLLVNPHDETNLLRIINEPSRGIGNKSIQDLLKKARTEGRSIWSIIQQVEELDVYKPAKARVREFVDMINRLRNNLENGETLTDTAKAALEQSGYMRALVEENSHESMMRRDNIIELQNAISYYEKGAKKASLSAFLQEISLITDADKFDESKPAITLMTVHASKGLEFPVVFIVGLEENLFPVGARQNFDVDIEEERRLFYVAITRAEKRLYFSHCRSRFKYGEETRQARSRFLEEVDAGVVQTETGATITQKKDRFSDKESGSSDYNIDYDWKESHTKKTYKSPSATIQYEYEDGEDPFQVGVKVVHNKFGPGKIISRSGLGTDAKVIVFFKNRGQKKLMLRAAPLQVID